MSSTGIVLAAKKDEQKPVFNKTNLVNQHELALTQEQEPLFPAAKEGRYGFINLKGEFVIPPRFASAGYFSEGLAPVQVEGKELVYTVAEGSFTRIESGKWGYVDRTGTLRISPQFGSVWAFSEGLAKATLWEDRLSLQEFIEIAGPNNPTRTIEELTDYWQQKMNRQPKAGYIDTKGVFRIVPKYDQWQASPFKHGIASVKLVQSVRSIGKPSEMKVFDEASGNMLDILAATSSLENQLKERWIDTTGLELRPTEALRRVKVSRIVFEKDRFITIEGEKYKVKQLGIKDLNGTVIMDAQFERIDGFYSKESGTSLKYTEACLTSSWITGRGMALPASLKCGLMDTHGTFIIPPDFDGIRLLSDSLVAVAVDCSNWVFKWCTSAKWGLFSIKENRIVTNPQFNDIGWLGEDLIPAKVGDQWGYIDTSGRFDLQPQFTDAAPFKDGLARVNGYDYVDRTGRYVYRGSGGQRKIQIASRPRNVGQRRTPSSTGTGFVVSKQGHVLTNYHVVGGCINLLASSGPNSKPLTVVGMDESNDIALLKLTDTSLPVAHFREGRNIRPGDTVVVVGFPLHGVLADQANVTTGTVSALAGLGNDTRFLQISAPVQPGNSGGPLLDQAGNIAGIVVSKLDTMKVAKATGDISQNVNFAINGTVAKAFLDAYGVDYEIAISTKKLEAAEIGASAKKFTLLIECYR